MHTAGKWHMEGGKNPRGTGTEGEGEFYNRRSGTPGGRRQLEWRWWVVGGS
jgi:hypothetical protein